MNYQESIDWLYGTQTFGIKLGLENVNRLISEFGLAGQLSDRKVIHVAGTNGKGSVCAFSDRILRDAGVKTGLFTSPHLITFRERIQINGEMISEEAVASGLTKIRDLIAEWEPHPTFFEITLILALLHFCADSTEVIILETGMGGRLDATNAVQANVSVITSIALDHQQWLGETIREIAAEKAGILKPNVPVIVAEIHPDARDVIGRRALTLGIPYIEAHPLPDDWKMGLPGPHQKENATLAVEAVCRVEDERLTREGIQESLARTTWRGRFQVISDRLILDGAHNPHAAEVLAKTWATEFPGEKATLIFGAAEGKDIIAEFRVLLPVIESIIFVPIQSERRLSADVMKAALETVGGTEIKTTEAISVAEALEMAKASDHRTLVAGSLFLVGEALSLIENGDFEVSLQ
ncbi:folylpolyglutamate synthase/dihydrofolate synthase family protein [Verrucomicrobiales bacterium BCK34]|nr:folylpolyglutamate synthase/dihydrofolate synthase family protein [Verrucomicrobiales bacterium BCK34]